MNKERILQAAQETAELLAHETLADDLVRTYNTLMHSLKNGGTIFVCGNGGSAEQAGHFAGELVGRFKKERKGIRAVALGMAVATLTAWSNDYDYEGAFSRELETLGRSGDVLVGLSTSGNSKNVIHAVAKAKDIGMQTVGFLGKGGALASMVDVAVRIPAEETARVQEAHLFIIHMLSEAIEDALSV
ncbi:MAG: phosphoheptose isomerase [Candidatus Niyogibacteria bacterium CG10_big_fil_rev_8_21_14_0_10_46_36]|uniref:Phosphoheptose isomerase n=1 Tax=Candidatus Niyogibacteria bacterium CG10_big_fil_rev_8_21_14_0_10_46_36 TaxID=1974726 RepID=A0A2H0TDL9_9BACT|nr:MAG: phosphoheptose isomerase [Candidatus Niyogibacteria bacterium CG10_big_fil_rev_8_21_14_0_10_46_36]